MFKLASSIGLALALADLKRRIRHWVRTGILGAIGAVLALIALCFFLVAAHLYLSILLNPIASAAIIGGVLLLIALILFFIASRPMASRASAPKESEPAANVGDALKEGMARLGQAAGSSGSPLRNPLFQAAGVALIAGFFFGRRSKRDKD
jgi:amino acid transporter